MFEIMQLMNQHNSIRKFKDQPVTEAQLAVIIDAAQRASTSSNMQAFSVIAIDDPALQAELAALAAGQAYVASCPLFLIWCADLHHLEMIKAEDAVSNLGSTENFVIGVVDAALAAENAALAAEALGLGICFIGGIRQSLPEITKLLHIPRQVFPIFGMCVGVPDQAPVTRPRLPRPAILHRNQYRDAEFTQHVQAYDETYRAYFLERSHGRNNASWSEQMQGKITSGARDYLAGYLREQGFMQH
jgi:FMN reductase (NADPH)